MEGQCMLNTSFHFSFNYPNIAPYNPNITLILPQFNPNIIPILPQRVPISPSLLVRGQEVVWPLRPESWRVPQETQDAACIAADSREKCIYIYYLNRYTYTYTGYIGIMENRGYIGIMENKNGNYYDLKGNI